MVKKIALEEHFLCPGFEDYWRSTVGNVDPKILSQVVARLSDFGEQRLTSMDGAGQYREELSCRLPASVRPIASACGRLLVRALR